MGITIKRLFNITINVHPIISMSMQNDMICCFLCLKYLKIVSSFPVTILTNNFILHCILQILKLFIKLHQTKFGAHQILLINFITFYLKNPHDKALKKIKGKQGKIIVKHKIFEYKLVWSINFIQY